MYPHLKDYLQWNNQIASYIKSLGAKQLVMDGAMHPVVKHAADYKRYEPAIDILSLHFYVTDGGDGNYTAKQQIIRAYNAANQMLTGNEFNRPLIIGEVGPYPLDKAAHPLLRGDNYDHFPGFLHEAPDHSAVAGILFWSLRTQQMLAITLDQRPFVVGGFLHHTDYNNYKFNSSYHWPGSKDFSQDNPDNSGTHINNNEMSLMRLVQCSNIKINSTDPGAIQCTEDTLHSNYPILRQDPEDSPTLVDILETPQGAELGFYGSVDAQSYRIERVKMNDASQSCSTITASSWNDPANRVTQLPPHAGQMVRYFTASAPDAGDLYGYVPFIDQGVTQGSYCYRVVAQNSQTPGAPLTGYAVSNALKYTIGSTPTPTPSPTPSPSDEGFFCPEAPAAYAAMLKKEGASPYDATGPNNWMYRLGSSAISVPPEKVQCLKNARACKGSEAGKLYCVYQHQLSHGMMRVWQLQAIHFNTQRASCQITSDGRGFSDGCAIST
ncbi:hypothetical protein [Dongshaea marina]|uniref:hypothetical protein n=1 Tax=Dongshaea marina TaxID=2047966 RepID=UPI002D784EC9|nr:hypothetical protein [Dongshaea marina]